MPPVQLEECALCPAPINQCCCSSACSSGDRKVVLNQTKHQIDFKSHQWFGATVRSHGDTILVSPASAGPRWVPRRVSPGGLVSCCHYGSFFTDPRRGNALRRRRCRLLCGLIVKVATRAEICGYSAPDVPLTWQPDADPPSSPGRWCDWKNMEPSER